MKLEHITNFGLFFFVPVSLCYIINNEIMGPPVLKCSDDGITLSIITRNRFRGNLYVRGQFDRSECKRRYYGDYYQASFTVPIGDCGMRRIPQRYPTGTMYVMVVVASFHPQFLTKFDKAYLIKCLYLQDDKDVHSKLDVSSLPTEAVRETKMMLPACEYSLREKSVDGPLLRYARIGEKIVHRWECDNPSYGILVKNCYVNDGGDTSLHIVDSHGCPMLSPMMQGLVSYDKKQALAYITASAFKFPDKPQLYFQCQIQICNKRDDECKDVTPPKCHGGKRYENTLPEKDSTGHDETNDSDDPQGVDDSREHKNLRYFRRKTIEPIELRDVVQSSMDGNTSEHLAPNVVESETPDDVLNQLNITNEKITTKLIRKRALNENEANISALATSQENYIFDTTFEVVAKALFRDKELQETYEGDKILKEYICFNRVCFEKFRYLTVVGFLGLILTALLTATGRYIQKQKHYIKPSLY